MYYEASHHYQPILNLLAAAGSRGYYIPCNKIKFLRVKKIINARKNVVSVFKNLLVILKMLK